MRGDTLDMYDMNGKTKGKEASRFLMCDVREVHLRVHTWIPYATVGVTQHSGKHNGRRDTATSLHSPTSTSASSLARERGERSLRSPLVGHEEQNLTRLVEKQRLTDHPMTAHQI